MQPLTPFARPRRGLVAVLAGAALIGAAPVPASAHDTIRLRFQKQRMGTICTGTLTTASGRPIAGTTVSASIAPPLWIESGVIGFSATESITSSRGSFTMNHLGVNDTKADPAAIHVLGAVVTGSWNQKPLAGGLVFIRAHVVSESTIRGTVWIEPPHNGK